MTPQSLLAHLQERGVELIPEGENLRYRGPKGALTPELRAAVAEHKGELLGLLADVQATRQTSDSSPWPDKLAGVGHRRVGVFSSCTLCAIGSWARYGSAVLCLRCATTPNTAITLRYRAALRRCWRLIAKGERADVHEAMQAAEEVNRLLDEIGAPTATQLRHRWAGEWWHENKACPTCAGPVRHDHEAGDGTGR